MIASFTTVVIRDMLIAKLILSPWLCLVGFDVLMLQQFVLSSQVVLVTKPSSVGWTPKQSTNTPRGDIQTNTICDTKAYEAWKSKTAQPAKGSITPLLNSNELKQFSCLENNSKENPYNPPKTSKKDTNK